MEKVHKQKAINEKINMAREEIIKKLPLETYLVKNNLIFGEVPIEGNMLCPVHDDKNPSCHFNTEKNVYHCFSCQSKGSVVELDYGIHKRTNDSENLVKTILRLSKEYNIDIPNMFEYEALNRPKRNKIKKHSEARELLSEDMYAHKLKKLEESVKNYPINIRYVVYRNCERAILKEVSNKEMYLKIKDFLDKYKQSIGQNNQNN